MSLPTALIVDILTLAIIIVSALIGRRRGLIKTVSGIVALLLAFSLAGTLANIATPVISEKYVAPYIANEIKAKTEISPEATAHNPSELSEVFTKLGIPENIISDAIADVSKALTQSIVEPLTAITNSIAFKITHSVLFIVFFLILLLALKFFFKLVNLASKLPGVNFINRTLGLILGLIFGYLIVIALSYTLKKAGLYITDELIGDTMVLKFISELSPFSSFLK